jgi:hypothetical protein
MYEVVPDSITIVSTTGRVIRTGTGGDGMLIVDEWSGQPIMIVDDMGDEEGITASVDLCAGVQVLPGGTPDRREFCADRTYDYPITRVAAWRSDGKNMYRSFRPT